MRPSQDIWSFDNLQKNMIPFLDIRQVAASGADFSGSILNELR